MCVGFPVESCDILVIKLSDLIKDKTDGVCDTDRLENSSGHSEMINGVRLGTSEHLKA